MAYVRCLVEGAEAIGRQAVLTAVNSLPRLGALKAAVGGFHIVLIRNLCFQWFSYSNQYLIGNKYFLEAITRSIENDDADPNISILKKYMGGWRVGESLSEGEHDKLFVCFVCLHLYMYHVALKNADYVVYTHAISRRVGASFDEDIQRIEADILAGTGISLDLTDFSENVSNPFALIRDERSTRIAIANILSAMELNMAAGDSILQTAEPLLKDLWSEYAAFTFYAGGAERARSALAVAQRQLDDVLNQPVQGDRSIAEVLNGEQSPGPGVTEAHAPSGRRTSPADLATDSVESVRRLAAHYVAQAGALGELTIKQRELTIQYDAVAAERDHFVRSYEQLAHVEAELRQQYDAVAAERDHFVRSYDQLSQGDAELRRQYDAVSAERDHFVRSYEQLYSLDAQCKRDCSAVQAALEQTCEDLRSRLHALQLEIERLRPQRPSLWDALSPVVRRR